MSSVAEWRQQEFCDKCPTKPVPAGGCSQISIKMIPDMLYRVHVWRTWWPRQYVDVNIVEIILNKSGCIRSCIVLLQKGTPSLLTQEWHYHWSQHLIPVSLTSQISTDDDKPCCPLTENTALYHDAASTKRVHILDGVWRQSLSPMSINMNLAIISEHVEAISSVNRTRSQSRRCHRRTVRAPCTLRWRCRRLKAIQRKGRKALIPALRSRRKSIRLLMGCPSAVGSASGLSGCGGLQLALWPLVFPILDGLVPGLSADNGSTRCWWRLDCSWRFLQSAVERPPYRPYRPIALLRSACVSLGISLMFFFILQPCSLSHRYLSNNHRRTYLANSNYPVFKFFTNSGHSDISETNMVRFGECCTYIHTHTYTYA